MNGAPKNLQRDGSYENSDSSANKLTWQVNLKTTPDPIAQVNPVVYVDYGYCISGRSGLNTGPNDYGLMGLFIQQPIGDRHPYRVKAIIHGPGAIVVGYGDATISNPATIFRSDFIPFTDSYDGLIIIEEPTATYQDRALFFGLAVWNETGASVITLGHLSVQNLGVKPPTMQNAVS